MAMNLVRTGVSLGVGVGSGVLSDETRFPPLELGAGGQKIAWATVVEAIATIGGLGLQLMAPFTAPNLADGLVDGGVALLGARGAGWAMTQVAPPAVPYRAQLATRVSPESVMSARGQIGSVSKVGKFSLS